MSDVRASESRGKPAPAGQCIGFGPYVGTCENPAGHAREPGCPASVVWCLRCDRLRIEHLNGQFAALAQRYGIPSSQEGK